MAKQSKHKCLTLHCRNKHAKGQNYCHTCTRKKWRAKNPEKYAYYTLKYNAKRRGKIFTLTFEEFKTFAASCNYMTGKGKTAQSLSIDCIIPEAGYTPENIQPLSLALNGRKADKLLVYDWQTRTATVIKFSQIYNDIENPF
jgi:hypothetical protein